MSKRKVMTIVGTRPEIIRLSRVIAALDASTEHVLVHTGQNYDYELNEIFFEDLSVRPPDHFLEAAGGSPLSTVGNVLGRAYDLMLRVEPDAVLALGDTNSCLALYSAKRLRIPSFHMEAGNRCFDERVPEEINRRIIDHISDINLPYSRHARDLLLREGIPPDRIVVTGSPMLEVLTHHKDKIQASDVLTRLGLEPGKFFVVSVHREENVDGPGGAKRLLSVLRAIWDNYGLTVVVSTHPRTAKRLDAADLGAIDGDVRFLKPFGFTDYVRLQQEAFAVLSDSGTISEESAILGLPGVNLRETHERHEAMEEAVVPMAGLDAANVVRAVELVTAEGSRTPFRGRLPIDYDAPDVSQKVVRLIESYIPYVRRTVWGGLEPCRPSN